jgi:hypothetical protein
LAEAQVDLQNAEQKLSRNRLLPDISVIILAEVIPDLIITYTDTRWGLKFRYYSPENPPE